MSAASRSLPALRTVLLGLTVGALLLGCGGGGADGTTVRGKITVGGQPVTSGLINFLAAGARPLGGPINSDGSYEFVLPPGQYQVLVDTPPPIAAGSQTSDTPAPSGPRQVPEKFANFNSSGLTASVADQSEQTLDFSL